MRTQAGSVTASALLPGIVLFAMLSAFSEGADAQRKERQGKEVVDAVCSECHVSGKEGAPRIGDANAWAGRASQGLTALTDHAIKGIRKMPAHGGNRGVSDIEIERAIVYMVNNSGGNWVEPMGGATLAACATARRSCRRNAPSATRPERTARPGWVTARRGPLAWPRAWTGSSPRPFMAMGRCRPAAECRT